jgi:hypothetical protein
MLVLPRLFAALAAALVVAVPGMALAGSVKDPEIVDARGDAGAAGVGLGETAADFDIIRVWFETDAQGTWISMELARFDQHPPGVLWGVSYMVEEQRFGVGFALFPQNGGLEEGYGGCLMPPRNPQADCRLFTGGRLQDRPGFRLLLPTEWAPAGATLAAPTAGVFPLPALALLGLPAVGPTLAGATMLDQAGPGRDYVVPDEETATDAVLSAESTPLRAGSSGLPLLGIVAAVALGAAALTMARRR